MNGGSWFYKLLICFWLHFGKPKSYTNLVVKIYQWTHPCRTTFHSKRRTSFNCNRKLCITRPQSLKATKYLMQIGEVIKLFRWNKLEKMYSILHIRIIIHRANAILLGADSSQNFPATHTTLGIEKGCIGTDNIWSTVFIRIFPNHDLRWDKEFR